MPNLQGYPFSPSNFLIPFPHPFCEVFSSVIKIKNTLSQLWTWDQGRPSPLRPWCISSPLLQISPYFRKMFRVWENFSQFNLFPKNVFIDHKFRIFSLLFSVFQCLSPCFAKIIISPLLWQIFPSFFRQFHLLFTYFTCISFSPYTLTVMHLCITQCTYWTPLLEIKYLFKEINAVIVL